jgi:hypothetical protein
VSKESDNSGVADMGALVWFSTPREMNWDAAVRRAGMKRKMSFSEGGIFGG